MWRTVLTDSTATQAPKGRPTVPVPVVDSLRELNDRLARYDRADDHRRIEHRVRTVGQYVCEAPMLRPLPGQRVLAGSRY